MTTIDPWTGLSYTIVLSAMVGFVRWNILWEMAKFFLTSPTLGTLKDNRRSSLMNQGFVLKLKPMTTIDPYQ